VKPSPWTLTPEREQFLRANYTGVKGNPAEVAERIQVPAWKVKVWAAELGLTWKQEGRKPWTAEEESFLWTHCGTRTVTWMARQLKRSVNSVAVKIKAMRLRRRISEGYTATELTECFGVDHRVIERWARAGWLRVQTRGYELERDAWAVTDAAILEFIEEHPTDFDLRRVNQIWFMDLILSGKVIAKALADLRRDDDAA
jgi:hypothetical protein